VRLAATKFALGLVGLHISHHGRSVCILCGRILAWQSSRADVCRFCIGCPNSIVGDSYEGVTAGISPFPVLSWQDCCAACQLYLDCAAWVHYVPPAAGPQTCHFRTSITRLNRADSAGNRATTGIMFGWSNPQPSPPPPSPRSGPPPPPLPPVKRYKLRNGVH
jgi:hypothetical protein